VESATRPFVSITMCHVKTLACCHATYDLWSLVLEYCRFVEKAPERELFLPDGTLEAAAIVWVDGKFGRFAEFPCARHGSIEVRDRHLGKAPIIVPGGVIGSALAVKELRNRSIVPLRKHTGALVGGIEDHIRAHEFMTVAFILVVHLRTSPVVWSVESMRTVRLGLILGRSLRQCSQISWAPAK